jgi:hypothetical protein
MNPCQGGLTGARDSRLSDRKFNDAFHCKSAFESFLSGGGCGQVEGHTRQIGGESQKQRDKQCESVVRMNVNARQALGDEFILNTVPLFWFQEIIVCIYVSSLGFRSS